MELDQTNIVIRERGASETLDLSLFVLRENIGRLLLLLALGSLPFALANYLAVGWMLDVDSRDYDEMTIFAYQVRHYFWMISLITIEAPLATVFITRYLGDYVFLGKLSTTVVVRDVVRRMGSLLYAQGIIRGGLLVLVFALMIDSNNELYVAEVLCALLLMGNLLVRAVRPYINELLLLERNPIFFARPNQLTAGVRSARLHRDDSSALNRFLTGCAFGVVLALSLINLSYSLGAVLFVSSGVGPLLQHVVVPMSCWLAVGFVSVTRFLNYLNRRIEAEGWELELRVKAEAARLFSEPVV